jgi:hypothetical protein
MASTEIASRPSTADAHVFTIKAATLKFETRHDLLPYLTPLIENPDVEEVHLSGNTYGVEACEFLGQVLSTKKNLKVLFPAPLHVSAPPGRNACFLKKKVLTEQKIGCPVR